MRNHPNCCGNCGRMLPTDRGPAPYVLQVNQAAKENCSFRTAIWTGCNLQMTLMSIPVGGDIGVEMHADTDQYIRVEEGQCLVMMGCCRERLDMRQCMGPNVAVFIPAGTWHNIVNISQCPLKLSSVYAPPQHPHGTVHMTRQDAMHHPD